MGNRHFAITSGMLIEKVPSGMCLCFSLPPTPKLHIFKMHSTENKTFSWNKMEGHNLMICKDDIVNIKS